MATGHGNTVVVRSQQEFEKLLALNESTEGWFDPAAQTGVVKFPTPQMAEQARRAV